MPGRGKPRPDIKRLRAKKRKAEEAADQTQTKKGRGHAATTTSSSTQTQSEPEPVETLSLLGDAEAKNGKLDDINPLDAIFKPINFAEGQGVEIDQVRCGGDGLALHVPMQLKEKIWNNEYVNLSLLLKGNIELNDFCSGGLIHLNESGILETRPKSVKQAVSTISEWTDAFIIFCSIYWLKYPNAAQDMLKYMSIVREAACRFGVVSWRSYDQQFRLRQSNALTRQSWGSINSELWVRCMTSQSVSLNNGPSPRATATSDMFKPHTSREVTPQRTCNDFNQLLLQSSV